MQGLNTMSVSMCADATGNSGRQHAHCTSLQHGVFTHCSQRSCNTDCSQPSHNLAAAVRFGGLLVLSPVCQQCPATHSLCVSKHSHQITSRSCLPGTDAHEWPGSMKGGTFVSMHKQHDQRLLQVLHLDSFPGWRGYPPLASCCSLPGAWCCIC